MQDDLVFHDYLSETIEKIHNSTFLGQNPSLERNFFINKDNFSIEFGKKII